MWTQHLRCYAQWRYALRSFHARHRQMAGRSTRCYPLGKYSEPCGTALNASALRRNLIWTGACEHCTRKECSLICMQTPTITGSPLVQSGGPRASSGLWLLALPRSQERREKNYTFDSSSKFGKNYVRGVSNSDLPRVNKENLRSGKKRILESTWKEFRRKRERKTR